MLKLYYSMCIYIYMCVCVCVCVHMRELLINTHVNWIAFDWLVSVHTMVDIGFACLIPTKVMH